MIEQRPDLVRDGWGLDVVGDRVVMANLPADLILMDRGVIRFEVRDDRVLAGGIGIGGRSSGDAQRTIQRRVNVVREDDEVAETIGDLAVVSQGSAEMGIQSSGDQGDDPGLAFR